MFYNNIIGTIDRIEHKMYKSNKFKGWIMPTLSLCMIVKNEEEYIKAALESAKAVVDEIIILDTGSTDRTKFICSDYTDKIYETEWKDDFGDARNKCIEKASGDWVLWLDADERILIKNETAFKELLLKEDSNVFSVKLLHLTDSESEEEKKYFISYHNRLFRRTGDFFFKGSIHEKLVIEPGIAPKSDNAGNCVEIIHYGYGRKNMKEKALRNLNICLEEKRKDADDPWLDYFIACELFRLGDIKDALELVNQAIIGFLSKSKMPPALLYKLKYDILIDNGKPETVCEGLEKVINLYKDYVELHFYHGISLLQLDRYEAAIREFSYCVLLGEEDGEYLIRCGSGSFLAYYYMGEAYAKSGDKENACEAFRQALLYHPGFNEAQRKLEELKI